MDVIACAKDLREKEKTKAAQTQMLRVEKLAHDAVNPVRLGKG
jgi:hypothetical protein